jgi:hypothetical protein
MPNNRRAFRLRFGDGRFAPAPFLRLCACAPLSRSPNRRPKQNRQDSRVSMAMLKVKGVNVTKPGTTVRLMPPRRSFLH